MNLSFCSGSKTSSKADDGSPLKSDPNLSISSSKNTGFFTFILDKFDKTLPAIAPT